MSRGLGQGFGKEINFSALTSERGLLRRRLKLGGERLNIGQRKGVRGKG